MDIGNLVDKIKVELDEETVSMNISYLPSSFDTMKSLVDDLSRIKKRWDITVLEKDNSYILEFEDILKVSIPMEHYDDFNENIINIRGVTSIDFSKKLTESINEYKDQAYGKLYSALTKILKANKHISSSTTLMKHWLRTFPNSKFVAHEENVAISLNNYENEARRIVEEAKKIYGDDIGKIDSIIDSIEDGRPVIGFDKYEYIAGVKILSSYEDVNLAIEIIVNMSMIPVQSIYIDNVDVLDALEGYSSLKVLYRRVFPVNGEFSPSIFGNIKEVIEDEA